VLASVAVFWAGFCVSGGQVGANALSAGFYPTDCRATGVSWANGVGRLGSVVGSVGGASMLAMGWSMPALFAAIGVPAVLAGLTMLTLGRLRHHQAMRAVEATA
jgi:AAHS family 4-hydroxybenzoate transporter-like MFS transporter